MKKKNLILWLILLFAFIFYSSSLSFFFISDDFFHISFNRLAEIFKISPSYNHYIPVFLSSLFIIKKLFGTNPFVFHLYVVLLHILNIFLVYVFTKEFLKSSRKALIVSLLFSFFYSHYEAVYWITGTTNSLMTLFYLLSLISFQMFTKTRKNICLVFTGVLIPLAFLSHEHAITLIPIIICYGIYRKVRVKNYKILLLPIFLFCFISILKIENTHLEVVKIATFSQFYQSVIRSNIYLLIPIPFIVDNIPKGIPLLAFLILMIIIFILIKKETKLLFCLIWLEIHILLFSSTSLPQPRYFYLASIPALCLIISFLSYFKKNVQFVPYMFLLIGFIIFLSNRSREWKETSMIMRQTITSLNTMYSRFSKDKKVYFVNLPDSLNGPPWNAYLFRNGVERLIEYASGILPNNIYYLKTVKNNILLRNDPYINTKELYRINNSAVMLYKEGKLYFSERKIKEEK
ncbi:hypothetical protein A3D77_07640 [Candidatus Gottesmanbacteria bacterium RIFCSPHIGHO2_02_FULL_39_11]|uniref:Glycosyltransferase RgtA/B/C/D-like domain-containing protein n=1 Tax=Candidatus Gottesmanbacteria bacterium RIFCSPHIGHO2_02_FULL_39_11 TaxID=1798382 RepID=A0A1F5ZSR0_9BACT|nr:MAG: hypothetical protein A3D77_07640 [Candidatus Gottesmanbacteria bacterium RIFCSPHIGHO2_02_FULL_39_11]